MSIAAEIYLARLAPALCADRSISTSYFPAVRVRGVGVQTNRSRSGQPPKILLRLERRHHQGGIADQDSQHKLHQGFVIPKQAAHEIIVDRPQPAQPVQVSKVFPLLLRCFPIHRDATCLYI